MMDLAKLYFSEQSQVIEQPVAFIVYVGAVIKVLVHKLEPR